jgi:hypothetical protein
MLNEASVDAGCMKLGLGSGILRRFRAQRERDLYGTRQDDPSAFHSWRSRPSLIAELHYDLYQ